MNPGSFLGREFRRGGEGEQAKSHRPYREK